MWCVFECEVCVPVSGGVTVCGGVPVCGVCSIV